MSDYRSFVIPLAHHELAGFAEAIPLVRLEIAFLVPASGGLPGETLVILAVGAVSGEHDPASFGSLALALDPKTCGDSVLARGGGVAAVPRGGGVASVPRGGGVAAVPRGGGVASVPRGGGVASVPRGDRF